MKLTVSFAHLDELLQRMGARAQEWIDTSNHLGEIGIRDRLKNGIVIDIQNVEVAPNGVLTYQGEVVLLHIRDTYNDRDTLTSAPEDAVRFHVADCSWIDDRRKKGRLDRYVVTNSTSGIFTVYAYDRFIRAHLEEQIQAGLKVCKLCLKRIDYKGSVQKSRKERTEIWQNFSIAEFLEKHTTIFASKPKYTVDSAPRPGYGNGWEEESRAYRANVGWKCECCGLNLDKNQKLLHTHHLNGVQGDRSASNLKALCVLCHSDQPDHRMGVSHEILETIHKLRRAQGIPVHHKCRFAWSSDE